ncbi:hypothetical protein V2J09_021075 [Rumex salicifolius]
MKAASYLCLVSNCFCKVVLPKAKSGSFPNQKMDQGCLMDSRNCLYYCLMQNQMVENTYSSWQEDHRYQDDKSRVKDLMKSDKEFGLLAISDINLKMSWLAKVATYKSLLYLRIFLRGSRRKRREAKKHQRMLDDFSDLLHSMKIFEDYIIHIQEKAKEKDLKCEEEKKTPKERRIKTETGSTGSDTMILLMRAQTEDREESKRSRRHGSDRIKSRKHDQSPDIDGEVGTARTTVILEEVVAMRSLKMESLVRMEKLNRFFVTAVEISNLYETMECGSKGTKEIRNCGFYYIDVALQKKEIMTTSFKLI